MAKLQRWTRRGSAGEASEGDAGGAVDTRHPEAASEASPDNGSARPSSLPAATDRAPVVRRLMSGARRSTTYQLVLTAHPRQAVLTAAALGALAIVAGRPLREAGVVALTVLVGQTILGWHNDLVDVARDRRHETRRKPIAQGDIEAGQVWFALAIGVLVLVPLAVATGVTAGLAYLAAVLVGLLGNLTVVRRGLFSWLPWAITFALYPAYLSYGGWGGSAEGPSPEILVTVLAALLGVGVHVLRALWGLVPDNEDGWTYLPLRLGVRLGATKLLVLGGSYTALMLILLGIAGATVGLSQ